MNYKITGDILETNCTSCSNTVRVKISDIVKQDKTKNIICSCPFCNSVVEIERTNNILPLDVFDLCHTMSNMFKKGAL